MGEAKRRWISRIRGEGDQKRHRICRKCHQIIRKHEKWRQVKRKILGIFGVVFEIEHRDCNDPKLLNKKSAAAPEPPMEKWLRENNLPLKTWTGTLENKSEIVQ